MNKKYLPFGVFGLLAIAVLFPLLRPGFILTLDMVFAPKISIPSYASGPQYVFWGILHLLNMVIPSAAIEKGLLFGILFLSGWGMYRLLQAIPTKITPEFWTYGSYFGGILYMVNPFVYDRFMAGQFAVLLGYALVPFFVHALIGLCKKPDWRSALWTALWATGIAIASLHILGMIVLISVGVFGYFAFTYRAKITWLRLFLRWTGGSLIAAIVLNLYWLIPVAMGKGTTLSIINGFKVSDEKAFATNPGHLGLIGNILSLQGFWGESKNLFLVPSDVFGWWLIPIILLWTLVIIGIVFSWRNRRSLTIAILGLIIAGIGLSVGTAGTMFAPLNQMLLDHMPFFGGYREPQKFVVLIVLGYGYFGAVGVARIAAWIHGKKDWVQHMQSVMAVCMIIPLLCTPLMLLGFHNQIHATDYPVQWYAIRDRLDVQCTGSCKVLFLPWHLYMHYDFAGRVIASPADKFFGSKIVASNDPELAGASPYGTTAAQNTIANTILPAAASGGTHMGQALKSLGIKYVILVKENDYKQYSYLSKQTDITVLQDIPSITLYEVQS